MKIYVARFDDGWSYRIEGGFFASQSNGWPTKKAAVSAARKYIKEQEKNSVWELVQ